MAEDKRHARFSNSMRTVATPGTRGLVRTMTNPSGIGKRAHESEKWRDHQFEDAQQRRDAQFDEAQEWDEHASTRRKLQVASGDLQESRVESANKAHWKGARCCGNESRDIVRLGARAAELKII